MFVMTLRQTMIVKVTSKNPIYASLSTQTSCVHCEYVSGIGKNVVCAKLGKVICQRRTGALERFSCDNWVKYDWSMDRS